MAKQSYESLQIGGLVNSVAPSQVPPGATYEMVGAAIGRRIVERRPGYGSVWSRTSAHASDVGLGHTYAAFQGTEEWLAVIKPNGSSTASLYAFNSSGSQVAVVATGLVASGDWIFRQYGDKVYACNAASGIWVHTVGNYSGNNESATPPTYKWKQFQPELSIGSTLGVSTERPPYSLRPFISTDTSVSVHESTWASDWFFSAIREGELSLQTSFAPRRTIQCATAQIVTIPSALDLTDVGWVYWEAHPVGKGIPIKSRAGNYALTAGFAISESTSVLNSGNVDDSTNRTFLAGMSWAASVEVVGTETGILYYRADIRGIANASKDAVRRLMFKIPCDWNNAGLEVRIKNIAFGGAHMWDKSGNAPEIEYAFAYYNPTTTTREPATRKSLPAGDIEGFAPMGSGLKLGAWVKLAPDTNGTLNGQGYTSIQVFRKATTSTGVAAGVPPATGGSGGTTGGANPPWKLIATLNNTGTPTFRDTKSESAIQAMTGVDLQFGDSPIKFLPDAIGLWKGHLILCDDRKLYFSWAGLPSKYLPPPESNFTPPEEDDLAQGRTLYMAFDRAEEVYGVVEQDALYAVGPNSCYAMIGDSALDATPCRRLPNSRGTVGRRAFCPHRGGALVASADGLWYYEINRAFTGSIDTGYRLEEMTLAVRESWKRVVGSGATSMVVVSALDEIWVFNAGRYLRLTRPDPIANTRQWEEGTYETIESVVYQPGYGVRAQIANGKLVRLWYDADGATYTTDNGTAISWSATTGWIGTDRRRVTAIRVVGSGTPSVTVEVDDGIKGVTTYGPFTRPTNRTWLQNISILPGHRYRVTVAGTAGATIEDLILTTESAEPGYGN